MYQLAVNKDFIAQHFLIGGDWGPENLKHSHHYRFEIQIQGKELDRHGYVTDIVLVKDQLGKLLSLLQDKTLNDLPEFKDINPSIENLARISFQKLASFLNPTDLTVKVWEDDLAWVTYQER